MDHFFASRYAEAARHLEAALVEAPAEAGASPPPCPPPPAHGAAPEPTSPHSVGADPMRIVILCNLGECYLELGLNRKALNASLQALSLDSNSLRCTILAVRSYIGLKRLEEAREAAASRLRQADVTADDIAALRTLHTLLQSLNNNDSATKAAIPAKVLENSVVARSAAAAVSAPSPSPLPRRALSALEDVIRRHQATNPVRLSDEVLSSAARSLAEGCGDVALDRGIVLGYALVNSGSVSGAAAAREVFEAVLRAAAEAEGSGATSISAQRKDMYGAHLGLGSAFAQMGKFNEAIDEFSKAITYRAKSPEGWKRRGQTRAASDGQQLSEALSDLSRAASLITEQHQHQQTGQHQQQLARAGRAAFVEDPDIFFQLGIVHYKMKNFRVAQKYFLKAISSGVETAEAYNSLGMARALVGDMAPALEAYARALELNPAYTEALHNSAILRKELGDGPAAEAIYKRCLSQNPNNTSVLYSLGSLHYMSGDHKRAVEVFEKHVLLTKGSDLSSLCFAAMSNWCVGAYPRALALLDDAVARFPEEGPARSQREVLLHLMLQMESKFSGLSLDLIVHPAVKSAWCKRRPWGLELREHEPSGSFRPLPPLAPSLARDLRSYVPDSRTLPMMATIRTAAQAFSIAAQLNCRGFLPNTQQHRMFGVSVLHMALTIRAAARDAEKKVQWRNFFSIAARLRQVSEPNDPVWWIDGLPRRSFEEGFGLETPLVTGQLKVVRYYAYFEKALQTLKTMLTTRPKEGALGEYGSCYSARGDILPTSGAVADLLLSAGSLEDVWSAVGQDLYVVVPCRSMHCDRVMEGTRLTLVASKPDGFQFTIRMPGTPQRWADFDPCLEAVMDGAVAAVRNYLAVDRPPQAAEELHLAALRLFYYWVIFAPLTRGSAVCGLAALHATLLAAGLVPSAAPPLGMQLDWEAILATDRESFESIGLLGFISDRFVPLASMTAGDSEGIVALRSVLLGEGGEEARCLGVLEGASVADVMHVLCHINI